MSARFLWRAFLLVLCACCCGAHDMLKHDLVLRVANTLQTFLNSTHFPTTQLVESFKLGLVQPSDASLDSKLHRLLFSQLLSVPDVGSFSVAFGENQILGVCRELMFVFTTQQINNATCSTPNDGVCVSILSLDNHGKPTSFRGAIELDAFGPLIQNQQSAHWSRVARVAPSSLGVAYSKNLVDRNGQQIGHTTASLTLTQLDNFVQHIVAETSHAIVYVVDNESQLLIAASIPNTTTTQATSDFAVPIQVSPFLSSNQFIRLSGQLLFSSSNWDHDRLRIHEDMFVLTRVLSVPGINWTIVATGSADFTSSYIPFRSLTSVVVLVVCGILMFTTGWLLGWLIKFRDLRLWRTAHYNMLVLFLVSGLGCVVAAVWQIGPPSAFACNIRIWSSTISCTTCFATLFGKVLLVRIDNSSTHFAGDDLSVKIKRVNILVASIVVTQLAFLLAHTIVYPHPVRLVEHKTATADEVYEECGTGTALGVGLLRGPVVPLAVLTTWFAFLSRNSSPAFGESRGLFLALLQGLLLAFMIFVLRWVLRSAPRLIAMLSIVSLTCFVATTELLLLIPRIYRQVAVGDLTPVEVREMMVQHMRHHSQDQSHSHRTPHQHNNIPRQRHLGQQQQPAEQSHHQQQQQQQQRASPTKVVPDDPLGLYVI